MTNQENITWDDVLESDGRGSGDPEGALATTASSDGGSPLEALAVGDWLSGLNEAQREAVTTTEGPVRVIAGAGTGKTRALAYRFAYLVNVLGILPGNILCATFTNKAAGEMRRRIRRLIGDDDTGLINTFHGFCVGVLQADGHALQLPKSFLVLDNGDIDAMLAVVYEERGLTLRDMTYADARDRIEMLKTRDRPDYYRDLLTFTADELRERYRAADTTEDIIFYGYLCQQKRAFGLDYNDLIILTLHLFEECPEVRRAWQERLEYVMVDEFQDIDGLQYRLMEVLAAHHGNLFVVGDPDQTIYSWRGADVRYLTEFAANFPGTRTIMMLENYRSVPAVVNVANSLIAKNRERIRKDLVPRRTDAGPAVWYHGADSPAEAAWIAEGVRALSGAGVALGDIAVLYRAHYASRAVEEALIREGIPHTVHSGVPFFARREVKDALSYLRFLTSKSDLDFRRIANVPRRNLGRRRMAFLAEAAEREGTTLYEALCAHLDDDIFRGTGARAFVTLMESYAAAYRERTVSELLDELVKKSGYEKMLRTEGAQERLDNLAELKQAVYEYEATCGEELSLEQYLTHVALLTAADEVETGGDKVRLMTIHAAKGLEFPHVFVSSLSEGVIPSRKTETRRQLEEERRLAFVALTRARDGLYLTEAEGFSHKGSPRFPSRFLLEIDPALLMRSPMPADYLAQAREAAALADMRLAEREAAATFAVGDAVVHPVFGCGRVMSIDMTKRAYLVAFESLDTPRAISFKAPLDHRQARNNTRA